MDFNINNTNNGKNNQQQHLLTAALERQGAASSSGDAGSWSAALIASLAGNHQPVPPANNEVAVLQALLTAAAAGQQQNLQPMDIAGPSNTTAYLLASHLNGAMGTTDSMAAAAQSALTVSRAQSLPTGPLAARPRKSKKFRYSAALKQIRQAEAEGNPIRVDKPSASSASLSVEQHRSLVAMGAVEATPPAYSCGDARCQKQIETLQMELAYCKLEVDTLREALRTLIQGRSRELGLASPSGGAATSKEQSGPLSPSIAVAAESAPPAVAAAGEEAGPHVDDP